jgi:hypothetical protein
MGVTFDRMLEPFSGPFEKLNGFAPVPAGTVSASGASPWYAWSRSTNDGFAAANRLLKAGQEVYELTKPADVGGREWPAGTFLVKSNAATAPMLRALATERGVSFTGATGAPPAAAVKLRVPRIALWDVYGGSMSSGWMRFVFEQFEFPYEVVFAKDLDEADLNSKYDVIIFPDDASFASSDTTRGFEQRGQPAAERVPEQWRNRLGRITVAKTLPRIKSFIENGGVVLALGDAADMAYRFDLPVTNAIVGEDGKQLPRAKFYVPGSVLSVAVDTGNPIAWGMRDKTDIFYDNNPAFRVKSDADGVKAVARFDSEEPLRSGWAWGQKVLDGASQVVVAPVGKGAVVLYGPQVHFRGQTHGAFPFLFNGVFYSQAR